MRNGKPDKPVGLSTLGATLKAAPTGLAKERARQKLEAAVEAFRDDARKLGLRTDEDVQRFLNEGS